MKKNLFLIGIVFLTGCSSVKPIVANQEHKSQERKSQEHKSQERKSHNSKRTYKPNWITNSNVKGSICNIGSAVINNNFGITKRIATIKAKSNISQEIQSYISTKIKLETKCLNQECKERFSSKINIKSTQMIRNVKEINQYIDTNKGIYYIHLCTKI